MPNQRDKNKVIIGAYVDPEIKAALKKAGIEETSALEMYLIKTMVEVGELTKEQVKKLADKGRLRSATVLFLKHQGIIL